MRSIDEIVTRLKESSKTDIFGFEVNEYFRALTPAQIEKLKPDIIKQDADFSNHIPDLIDDASLEAQCIEYMPFAWEKANNCRGISAWRSLAHYKAWLWMLGQDEFDDMDDYEYYGKPHLERICKFLLLDPKTWDDGIRVNEESE